jgi:hypothetical protein
LFFLNKFDEIALQLSLKMLKSPKKKKKFVDQTKKQICMVNPQWNVRGVTMLGFTVIISHDLVFFFFYLKGHLFFLEINIFFIFKNKIYLYKT